MRRLHMLGLHFRPSEYPKVHWPLSIGMIDPSTRLRRAILLNDVVLVQRITRNNPRLLHNPDFEDKSNTSLHLAASLGFIDIAAHLLAAGHEAGEISRNTDHDTPLILAARNGHVDLARLLIKDYPACIQLKNKVGADALATASQHPESTALIPYLLDDPEFPADVDVRDQDGNTPLHHASASGSLKALRILLTAGANPLAKNNYDWTPLAYSQTVAAEVYFKNLVAEFERRKVEGQRLEEERERQRAAGVRVVDDEGSTGGTPRRQQVVLNTPIDEDESIADALKRHWTPVQNMRPMTPGSVGRRDWDNRPQHLRTRSGSGD